MKCFRKIYDRFETYDLSMCLLIFVFFLFFFFLGWSRHYGFLTSINDMGHYDQAIWGITKKGFLLNTTLFNIPFNKLGFHFDPVLYLFSPLYYLKPTANWLILVQALALSVSAWPIYRLAGHYTQNLTAGFLWSAAYLTNPFIVNAATWDFHPLTLAVPFVAYAVLAIERKSFYPLLLSCSFILLCKEHFGLMVSGFGLLWLLKHKEIGKSFFIVGIGAIHFILIFKYLMPFFSPTGEHLMLSKDLGQLSRYTWLGNSISEIVLSFIKNPYTIIRMALLEMGGMRYLLLLLMPFLAFPIFGLSLLLPAMGDLAANMLSANPMPRSVFAYHSVTLVPIFCTSAIHGSKRVIKFFKGFTLNDLAGFAFLSSLLTCYIFCPFPLPNSANFWAPKSFINFHDQTLDEIKAILLPSSSISVQANVGAHFTQREQIFSFPNKVDEVDAIVLRLDSPTTNLNPKKPMYIGTLAHHLQMEPKDYLDAISNLLSDNKYGISLWKNNWLVLKRNHADICSRKLVEDRIFYLERFWGKSI